MRTMGWGLALFGIVGMVGCGSGGNTTSPGSASSTSGAATSATSQSTAVAGPASARVTAVGGAGVSGTIIANSVQCAEPRPDGPVTGRAGQSTDTSVPFLFITVRALTVSVTASSGAAANITERDFSGSGVTGFDAAKGAQVNATLTETSPPSAKRGAIGVMRSLTATVDCGNQQPGSATITVSGSTAHGELSGTLTSARVFCSRDSQGNAVVVVHALAHLGSATVLTIIAMQAQGATIAGVGGFFKAPSSAATTSATGGHLDGDFVEQGVPAASAHTVHVSGDAVCGSSITP